MATPHEDEMAIRALMFAYADAVNRRDPEGMAAVLAPDAIIEKPGHGDPVQGAEKILKRYRRLQRERRFLCQMVHSGVVHVDGDRATARWWFSETKLPVDSDRWLTMIGVYQDEVARLSESLDRHEDALQKIQKERDDAVQKMNALSSELGKANQEYENLKAEKARGELALEESESERIRLNNELQKYMPQPAPKKKLAD